MAILPIQTIARRRVGVECVSLGPIREALRKQRKCPWTQISSRKKATKAGRARCDCESSFDVVEEPFVPVLYLDSAFACLRAAIASSSSIFSSAKKTSGASSVISAGNARANAESGSASKDGIPSSTRASRDAHSRQHCQRPRKMCTAGM